MQLDPTKPLVPQLKPVSGNALEQMAAAAAASVGYTVFRGLFIELGGQRAAETDVFAALFTPLRESRILLECKGGDPAFNDVRKFASMHQLLIPRPDDLLMVCKPGTPPGVMTLATSLNVRIVEKTNLSYYILPLLGGAIDRQRRAVQLNRYLAWQEIHDYLLTRLKAHPQLQKHYRFLAAELWLISDPAEQVTRSFDAYTTLFPGTSDVVAKTKGTTALSYLYVANDDDIEAALYVELMHRVMNVYAIARRTLQIIQHFGPSHLTQTAGFSLQTAVSALSAEPRYFIGFPSFLQTFFYIWGGFLTLAHRDWEIEQLAKECGTTVAAVQLYLRVLALVFRGTGATMFATWNGHYFFKYVPSAFRGMGITHRLALDSARYAPFSFFGAVGPAYLAALNRSLPVTGGRTGLRFT